MEEHFQAQNCIENKRCSYEFGELFSYNSFVTSSWGFIIGSCSVREPKMLDGSMQLEFRCSALSFLIQKHDSVSAS